MLNDLAKLSLSLQAGEQITIRSYHQLGTQGVELEFRHGSSTVLQMIVPRIQIELSRRDEIIYKMEEGRRILRRKREVQNASTIK